jgi:hypothetical protein
MDRARRQHLPSESEYRVKRPDDAQGERSIRMKRITFVLAGAIGLAALLGAVAQDADHLHQATVSGASRR